MLKLNLFNNTRYTPKDIRFYATKNVKDNSNSINSFYDLVAKLLDDNRHKYHAYTKSEKMKLQTSLENLTFINENSFKHVSINTQVLEDCLHALDSTFINYVKKSANKFRLYSECNHMLVLYTMYNFSNKYTLVYALLNNICSIFHNVTNYALINKIIPKIIDNIVLELLAQFLSKIQNEIKAYFLSDDTLLKNLKLNNYVFGDELDIPKGIKITSLKDNPSVYIYYCGTSADFDRWNVTRDERFYIKYHKESLKDPLIHKIYTLIFHKFNVLLHPNLIKYLISNINSNRNIELKILLTIQSNIYYSHLANVLFQHLFEKKYILLAPKSTIKSFNQYYLNNNIFPSDPLMALLPMVVEPSKFNITKRDNNDIIVTGGYLTKSSTQLPVYIAQYFDTYIGNPFYSKNKCLIKPPLVEVLNILQKCGFIININLLKFIIDNKSTLLNLGILLNEDLITNSISNNKLIRDILDSNKMRNMNSYNLLMNLISDNENLSDQSHSDSDSDSESKPVINMFDTDIQAYRSKALVQKYLLKLATVFQGYDLYYPTNLDYRGRIYRPGVLKTQASELAKNLLVFKYSDDLLKNALIEKDKSFEAIMLSIAHAFDKFKSREDALQWALDNYKNNSFPKVNSDMENPLLYLSYMIYLDNPAVFILPPTLEYIKLESEDRWLKTIMIPIQLDATSSVYQIMAYMGKDINLAEMCNIIKSNDHNQVDLYDILTNKFKSFINNMDDNLMKYILDIKLIVDDTKIDLSEYNKTDYITRDLANTIKNVWLSIISRKLVKSIVMPLPYGLSFYKAKNIIIEHLKLNYKDDLIVYSFMFVKVFMYFVNNAMVSPSMFKELLISFSNAIFTCNNESIIWDNKFITINQAYYKSKQHKLYLKGPSGKITRPLVKEKTNMIDLKKNSSAITANFIHSLDAFVCYQMIINYSLNKKSDNYYLNTNHDCFSTDVGSSHVLTEAYYDILYKTLNEPIYLINNLIINTLSVNNSNISNDKLRYHQIVELFKQKISSENSNNVLSKHQLDKIDIFINKYTDYCDMIISNRSKFDSLIANSRDKVNPLSY